MNAASPNFVHSLDASMANAANAAIRNKSFDLETFTFNGQTLRTIQFGGKPWFSAADIGQCLGNSARHIGSHVKRWLGEEDRRLVRKSGLPESAAKVGLFPAGERLLCSPNTLKNFQGKRVNSVNLISESGLYLIIMRAQRSNPAAKEVQDWVTKEVLPRIRRDGAYIMGEEKAQTGEVSALRPKRGPYSAPLRNPLDWLAENQ